MATDKLVDFDHVTDYISREAAIEAAKAHYPKANEMIAGIIIVPAADVRPVVRARWEDKTGYIISALAQRVYCPACKSYAYFYQEKAKNFCPNCGADMEGNENG